MPKATVAKPEDISARFIREKVRVFDWAQSKGLKAREVQACLRGYPPHANRERWKAAITLGLVEDGPMPEYAAQPEETEETVPRRPRRASVTPMFPAAKPPVNRPRWLNRAERARLGKLSLFEISNRFAVPIRAIHAAFQESVRPTTGPHYETLERLGLKEHHAQLDSRDRLKQRRKMTPGPGAVENGIVKRLPAWTAPYYTDHLVGQSVAKLAADYGIAASQITLLLQSSVRPVSRTQDKAFLTLVARHHRETPWFDQSEWMLPEEHKFFKEHEPEYLAHLARTSQARIRRLVASKSRPSMGWKAHALSQLGFPTQSQLPLEVRPEWMTESDFDRLRGKSFGDIAKLAGARTSAAERLLCNDALPTRGPRLAMAQELGLQVERPSAPATAAEWMSAEESNRIEGRTYRELAKECGQTEASVKALLKAAKRPSSGPRRDMLLALGITPAFSLKHDPVQLPDWVSKEERSKLDGKMLVEISAEYNIDKMKVRELLSRKIRPCSGEVARSARKLGLEPRPHPLQRPIKLPDWLTDEERAKLGSFTRIQVREITGAYMETITNGLCYRQRPMAGSQIGDLWVGLGVKVRPSGVPGDFTAPDWARGKWKEIFDVMSLRDMARYIGTSTLSLRRILMRKKPPKEKYEVQHIKLLKKHYASYIEQFNKECLTDG